MLDKIVVNEFVNALKRAVNEVEDESHHFDANSEQCKTCKDFKACAMFHGMLDKIEAADIDDNIKTDLAMVLEFIKKELLILDKDIEFHRFRVGVVTERFEAIKKCKNLDVLIAVLSKDELKYLRKIIFKVTNKIEEELNKVLDANRKECNYFMNILHKPEVETKRYEDMTREELLEELKKK